MLRAGPLSDERIIRLANRRFVPFFFDLADDGAVGDPEARKFVVKARREFRGAAVGTPPVLFMTAEGEVLAEADNFASADRVYAAMRKVLADRPEFAKETDEEKKLEGAARATLLVDLGDLDGARGLLEKAAGAGAAYDLGRVLRMQKDFDGADRAFARVDDAALADDVRMERAYRHWAGRDFAKLRDALADFPKASRRWTEARYYAGLAHYHIGDVDKACDTWKEAVKGAKQDAWIYRADWAYCNARDKAKDAYSSDRKGSSLLGRIGYMGGTNPDLGKE